MQVTGRIWKKIYIFLKVRFIVLIPLYTELTDKTKEAHNMKTNAYRYRYNGPRNQPRYPNEADRRYFEQKLLDGVTSVITGMGIVTIFLYLMLL